MKAKTLNTSHHVNSTRFSAAAAAGLRVFPVKTQGKEPALRWTEFRDREPTAEELGTWGAGDFNVGIICGDPSGIVVLDVDSPEAQAFVETLNLPHTPRVSTGRGTHYYFKSPPAGLRNGTKIAGQKLDLRGDGGYVVGPGSIHPSGSPYEWIVSPADVPFAEFPTSLLEVARAQQLRPEATPEDNAPAQIGGRRGKFDRLLAVAASNAAAELQQKEEGERNNSLFRIGASLARQVAGAGADWHPYAQRLRDVALKIGLDAAEIDATLASCWAAGSVEPTRWMVVAREWVYLSKPNVFYHLASREYLKIDAFNNTFKRLPPTENLMSTYLLDRGYVDVVHDLDYHPDKPTRYVEKDGLTWLNTYRPSEVVPTAGDPSPFIEFMSYLVPNEEERDHLLKMLGWTVRFPGKKLRHALLLRSERQGVGKTMLADIWTQLLGPHNVRKTTTEEISGQYQGFIKETLMVLLEELNWGVGATGYNRLKDLITGDVAPVNEKFIPIRQWPNVANLVILTNVPVPIKIEEMDRRFFYIDSPAVPREKGYYASFAAWWQSNLGVIRGYLDTVDLDRFNPYAPPPMTAAKRALIADSRTELAKDLSLLIEERVGVFNRDLVTLAQVEAELGTSMRGKSKSQLRNAMDAVGALWFGQQRLPRALVGPLSTDTDRVSLWAIRNTRYWHAAGRQARAEEFRKHEGLLAPFHGLELEICHFSEWPAEAGEFNASRPKRRLTDGELVELVARRPCG